MLRHPPHDVAAEQAVLGGMMLDHRALSAVALLLEPGDFFRRDHAALFRALLALDARGTPCDPVTIGEWIERNGASETIEVKYVLQLANNTPSAANIRAYAAIVRDKATQRRAIDAATRLIDEAFTPGGKSPGEVIDSAVRELMALHRVSKGSEWTMRQAVEAAYQHAANASTKADGITGIPTGLAALDDRLGGMQDSDLIVVGGRPGMGKTALLIGVARHAAMCGFPGGIISAEMAHRQIGGRALALDANVRASGLRNGRLSDDEWSRLWSSTVTTGKLPIWIDDDPAPTLTSMQRTARRWKQEHGIRWLGIDYLQRCGIEGARLKENERVSEVVVGVKNIARELDIPVLALSQIKQEVETRTNKRPTSADYADTDRVIREADVAGALYRDAYYNPPMERGEIDPAELIVFKNRHGATGKVDLLWHPTTMRYGDCDNG